PTREEVRSSTPANSTGPHTIGIYPPNPLGIYQMGLNGFEWINDWYDEDYYSNSPEKNPTGPQSGDIKVKREASFGEAGRAKLTIKRRKGYPDLSSKSRNGEQMQDIRRNHTFRCTLLLDHSL